MGKSFTLITDDEHPYEVHVRKYLKGQDGKERILVLCPFHDEKIPSCLIEMYRREDSERIDAFIFCFSCKKDTVGILLKKHEE